MKKGDVVRLKSGGVPMTVRVLRCRDYTQMIEADWMYCGQVYSNIFFEEQLEIYVSPETTPELTGGFKAP